MKLSLRQAILFLVGGAAGTAGIQSASTAVHADVVTVNVHHGDTTWGISRKYGTTVKKIVKDNHLKNGGHDIYENQKLKVDDNKGVTAATTTQASQNAAVSTAQSQTATSQAPSYNSAYSSQSNTGAQGYNAGTTTTTTQSATLCF